MARHFVQSTCIESLADQSARFDCQREIDSVTASTKYRHIAAWGKFVGILASHIRDEIRHAEEQGAPIDAIFRTSKQWYTVDAINNPESRAAVERLLIVGHCE